jgi:cytoplasmic iron level regulating protein YaaA (DUF328/UPF0246 family)
MSLIGVLVLTGCASVKAPDQLRAFDIDGYAWTARESSPERLVFRRKQEAA